MTIEERLSRIETALASAGLLEPSRAPGREEILRDLQAGDASSLRDYLRRSKGRITDGWIFGPESKNRR